MITFRRSNDRGYTKRSWLDRRHTFSFGEYYDHLWTSFCLQARIKDAGIARQATSTFRHVSMTCVD
jgi:redox-sensitive bicupin YhaK (pirin superfamily)